MTGRRSELTETTFTYITLPGEIKAIQVSASSNIEIHEIFHSLVKFFCRISSGGLAGCYCALKVEQTLATTLHIIMMILDVSVPSFNDLYPSSIFCR